MIKKILLTILWTVALTFGAVFGAVFLCVTYLKMTLQSARPDEHTHDIVISIWTYTSQIAPPIAFLLGVFGWLPGTRLRANSPVPSPWAKWCYHIGFAAFFLDSVISIFCHGSAWDILAIVLLVFLLGVAVIDKYIGRAKRSVNETPCATGQ